MTTDSTNSAGNFPSPIPFAAAKAYGVSRVAPASSATSADAATSRSAPPFVPTTAVDRAELSTSVNARRALRAKIDSIVAAKVSTQPFEAPRASSPPPPEKGVNRTGAKVGLDVLPMYRHPADRNAAAVTMQGNKLDVQG